MIYYQKCPNIWQRTRTDESFFISRFELGLEFPSLMVSELSSIVLCNAPASCSKCVFWMYESSMREGLRVVVRRKRGASVIQSGAIPGPGRNKRASGSKKTSSVYLYYHISRQSAAADKESKSMVWIGPKFSPASQKTSIVPNRSRLHLVTFASRCKFVQIALRTVDLRLLPFVF